MAMYKVGDKTITPKKKRTSVGNGLRKRGSYKTRGQKAYRGQGK
jgi:hypothetical protein